MKMPRTSRHRRIKRKLQRLLPQHFDEAISLSTASTPSKGQFEARSPELEANLKINNNNTIKLTNYYPLNDHTYCKTDLTRSNLDDPLIDHNYCKIYISPTFTSNLGNSSREHNHETSGDPSIESPLRNQSPSSSIISSSSTKDIFNLKFDLQRIAIDTNICGVTMTKILVILNQYFPWLPNNVRSLKNTPRTADVTDLALGVSYFYLGLSRALDFFSRKYSGLSEIDRIDIDLGIDGLPISKSSNNQIWPLMVNIVGYSDIFVISSCNGRSKHIDFNIFLKDFIEEMEIIEALGYDFRSKNIKVSLRALICDSDARCKVLHTKSHSGYFSCTKCTIKGAQAGRGHIVFPCSQISQAVARTNNSFKNRLDVNHHKKQEPISLEILRFGCVSQVPIDYMHCVLLGVTKQLLIFWIKKRKFPYSLSQTHLKTISDGLLKIKLPREFNRQPRSLDEFERWKATELRHFLLYTGPVVLKDKLPTLYYQHFLYLSCGISILLNKSLCQTKNSTAAMLLKKFVMQMEELYGPSSATFNVHSLLHLSDICLEFSTPLDEISAFKFENFLSSIKLKIKSGYRPLHQLYNRLSERYELDPKSSADKDSTNQLKSIYMKQPGLNFKTFMRSNLKTVFTDNLAQQFTLKGRQGNLSAKNFNVITLLNECAISKFNHITKEDCHNSITKYFYYVKDKIAKTKKQENVPSGPSTSLNIIN